MSKTYFLRPLVKTIPTKIAVCIERSAFEKIQIRYGENELYRWPFDENPRAMGVTFDLCGLVVVCLPTNVKTPTLVHESVHVFEAVMRDIGEKHPSEEFRAYSIQAIFEALQAEYIRLKKVLDVSLKR